MNEYEITYLSTTSQSEEDREKLGVSVDEVVTAQKGTIAHDAGSYHKKLAYPINKEWAGFVRTLQIELDPDQIDAVRDALKKVKGVMRFTILNTPKRKEVSPTIFEAASKQEEKPAEETSKPTKEVTMEEVEEKIDEALDEEVK